MQAAPETRLHQAGFPAGVRSGVGGQRGVHSRCAVEQLQTLGIQAAAALLPNYTPHNRPYCQRPAGSHPANSLYPLSFRYVCS